MFLRYIIVACSAVCINPSYALPLDGKPVRDAKVNELPFVVSIERRYKIGSNFCVGTLISRQTVLTAAHCLVGLNFHEVEIMAGSNDLRQGERYRPKFWISYEQWMNITDEVKLSRNDIAVITLRRKVQGCKVAAVLTFTPEHLYGSKVRIAGWGHDPNTIKPLILKTAVLTVISNEDCEYKIEKLLNTTFYVPENLFCSTSDPWVVGDCGDSGAPILNKQNQVVGIHRGVCPQSLRNYNYTEEFVNQNLNNIHLHLLEYRRFINEFR